MWPDPDPPTADPPPARPRLSRARSRANESRCSRAADVSREATHIGGGRGDPFLNIARHSVMRALTGQI